MRAMPGDRAAGFPGLVAAALLAAGCAGTPTVEEPRPTASDVRGPVVQLALSMVGVRYRYGGADPAAGFDCSGLVYYTFTSNGHAVPRTSQDQFNTAHKIPLAEAAEGDLVFFQDQERLSHVGIYLGNDQFLYASHTGDNVKTSRLSTYGGFDGYVRYPLTGGGA